MGHGPYDYYNADKYSPQNEPDLIAPYTYLSTGQPWKTTDVVHGAPTLFTDTPTGMTGNDDVGAMSARDVLSSIGGSSRSSPAPTCGACPRPSSTGST
ncbi:hypothetical protein GCM10010392_43270 [Streptomyces clavifer]|uniref:Alpha-1,2-mannosidase n=1 Tax=Streptomyces clavifer TaxID=68188 RepID=A0ABS4VJR6_9ACTN|nr:putative alpha-1,2-mannosidase [Streptomyces clavifer]GHB11019.1 hypothetical protein GCM10010392_43270 [Streptomyces clavifer]